MRKGIIALEDDAFIESEVPEAQADVELERDMAVSEGDSTEIESAGDQLAEAEGIQDTVDTMADQVEAKVDSGEGITEETAQALEVAVEHFCKRLGYSKQVVPSLEGFKSKESRLEQSKIALENLRDLSIKLDSSISIAQEGFFARIRNAFVRAFTSNSKMLKTLEKLKHSEAKPEELIEDPAWGRAFAAVGKTTLTGDDVVRALRELNKINTNKVIPICNKLITMFDKISEELSKKNLVASDESIKNIRAQIDVAKQIKEDLYNLITVGTNETSVDIRTANSNQIRNICDAATVAIRSNYYVSKIDETITVFYSTLYEANTNITNVLANSLGNLAFTPADVRAMQAVLERGAGETIDLLYSLQYIEQKIAYGAYRYVKASVR